MSPRTSSSRARPLLLAGLFALGGCLDDCGSDEPYDPQPGPGELGNGEFHYRCISDDDPACTTGQTVGDFPARVAVGGRFQLQYTWNEDDASKPPPDLRSSAPDRLHLAGEIFTPKLDGYTAVLALLGNSDIGDLIHILASTPTKMAIQQDRVDYVEYVIAVGEERQFNAITRDDSSHVLAGLLQFAFALDDPAVVETIGTGEAHVIVRGVSPGTTVLRATLNDLAADLILTVEAEGTTGDPTEGDSATGTTGDSTSSGSTGGSTGDASTGSTGDSTTGSTGSSSTGGVL